MAVSPKNPPLRPRQAVERMAPYHPPTGGRMDRLRLDFNENTLGCSETVTQFIAEHLVENDLAVYPEYGQAVEELAKFFKVEQNEFTITNGTDEAIQVLVNNAATNPYMGPMLDIDKSLEHCFREVTDHVRGAQEEIDSLSARLGLAYEASLLTSQAQQTEISRRLAAWAAILAVPTAMAGIYGMNFAEMPELQWKYGYPMVLGIVVVVCVTLFVNFRRAKWL